MADLPDRARAYVLDERAETVAAVLDAADAVAESWDGDATADSHSVAGPLRAELEAEGVWATLPDLLVGAVRATGHSLSASPVAAPPYVAATSRGPMLRATLDGKDDGRTDDESQSGGETGRLVILLQAFEVRQGDPATDDPAEYVRGPATPAAAVRANLK